MSLLADLTSTLFDQRYVPFRRWAKDGRKIDELCRDLLTSKGEVTGQTLAGMILTSYATLSDAQKLDFFRFLDTEMDIDPEKLRFALERYSQSRDPKTYRDLMHEVEPRRQELARRMNQVPGATHQLVQMRCDLIDFLAEHPELTKLDMDFRHLFASWFNRGFLVLRPINWESPAHILEKIIEYEAVHAIHSWEDLRRRLRPQDRRCFAFFHPAMPDEPLIFVEVALTKGIPNSIQAVLAEEREVLEAREADTAVFYSISNCQKGLAGISFGNSLIKQVADDLSRQLSGLKTFVTLSPVPSLMTWLKAEGLDGQVDNPDRLRALTARYLVEEKRGNGSPKDPVARFHLNNGAMLHDVHAGADTSPNGQARSAGAMVNYLYDLSRVARNHEAYAGQKQVVASSQVQALVRQATSKAEQTRRGEESRA
ncbi:MAG: malonyl-CoA decarboxylase domain-containing protein [Mangrovicoccus sp.]